MSNIKKDDLAPCPFCGSEADIECQGKSAWVVGCMNKSCEVFLPTYSWFTSRENAINAWNTRPAMSTWLEGEIKNIPQDEVIDAIVNNFSDKDIYEAIISLITRKLTGKV